MSFDDDGSNPCLIGRGACLRTSNLAILVCINGEDEDIWIPKSVVHDNSDVYDSVGQRGDVVVKHWWAEKEGHA